VSDCMYT